ncbi:hypothetical protein DAETH_41680 (plasmid) [Deinococcus aetherius]|uniref:Uncharacterized protein n=1 Tax=Deinococcus aetherius TaxID=200252 RepID=A0ABN6RNE9_9DEIO|nr:hypothetical protein DAETH_41680 [Deinococcus aetherius]
MGQVHDLNVIVLAANRVGEVQGEGRFADAAGAAQGDQPGPAPQKPREVLQVVLAAEEGAEPCRKRRRHPTVHSPV